MAKTLRYKALVHILGIDMSQAFDTIDRAKLLDIIRNIPNINNDDFRLIHFLLANTTLQVQFNGGLTAPFTSNIGSPQDYG